MREIKSVPMPIFENEMQHKDNIIKLLIKIVADEDYEEMKKLACILEDSMTVGSNPTSPSIILT